jgi:hypothetical protein
VRPEPSHEKIMRHAQKMLLAWTRGEVGSNILDGVSWGISSVGADHVRTQQPNFGANPFMESSGTSPL